MRGVSSLRPCTKAPLAMPKNAAINRPKRNDRQRFEKKTVTHAVFI